MVAGCTRLWVDKFTVCQCALETRSQQASRVCSIVRWPMRMLFLVRY